jgi:hypothetical protein
MAGVRSSVVNMSDDGSQASPKATMSFCDESRFEAGFASQPWVTDDVTSD